MISMIEIDHKVLVDLSTGDISIDGRREIEGNRLTPFECRELKCLVESYPCVATFEHINEVVWRREGEWGDDRLKIIQKFHSEIKRKCKLSTRIAVKSEYGYTLNKELDIKRISKAAITTESIYDLASKPSSYIEPHDWMSIMIDTAYINSTVFVISGERGIGKTTFARHFAMKCYSNQVNRKDLCFKNVVFTTYTGDSIRNTIELLPCMGGATDEPPFEHRIRLLAEMEKPTLLIIDNYDNDKNGGEELTKKSQAFRSLINTGCNILITSSIDLQRHSDVSQARLRRFSTEELTGLLFSITDLDEDNDYSNARMLVEKYLCNNTYLVVLTAHLLRTKSLIEIIEAFERLQIGEIEDPLNGRFGDTLPLIDQYISLLELSKLGHDESQNRLLYNLALLPCEGIMYEDFFECSFKKEEIAKYKRLFKKLEDNYWAFVVQRRISIHPLLREVIVRKKDFLLPQYINLYISNINAGLETDNYIPELHTRLKMAVSICDVVDKMRISSFEIAILKANLSSVFDMIGNKEATLKYGLEALSYLEQTKEVAKKREYIIARAYNNVGYALLHVFNNNNILSRAEMALYKAKSIIEDEAKEKKVFSELYYTNIGNIAALHISKHDYAAALELHRQNVITREEKIKREWSSSNARRLAASYKGVATCLYYLSKEKKASQKKRLEESYEYHSKAVDAYKSAYGLIYHVDIAVAENRRTATACELAPLMGHQDQIRLAKKSIERMQDAIDYICSIKVPIIKELRNSIENVIKAIMILIKMNSYDLRVGRKVNNMLNRTEYLHIEETSELREMVQRVNTETNRKH